MKIFLDTSALIKLYIREEEENKVLDYILQNENLKLVISELAINEFTSAIWKKVRTKHILKSEAEFFISKFKNEIDLYKIVPLDSKTLALSNKLLTEYWFEGLRTLD